jgi:hypothetical protein
MCDLFFVLYLYFSSNFSSLYFMTSFHWFYCLVWIFYIAHKGDGKKRTNCFIKGSLTGDFQLLVFFMNQCLLGPSIFHWGRFKFCRKLSEIFVNQCLSQLSTTAAISFLLVSTTPVLVRSRFCGLKGVRGL